MWRSCSFNNSCGETEWFCGVQLGGVKLPAEFPAARNSKSMVHAGTGRWRQKNGRPMLINNCEFVGSRPAVYRMAVLWVWLSQHWTRRISRHILLQYVTVQHNIDHATSPLPYVPTSPFWHHANRSSGVNNEDLRYFRLWFLVDVVHRFRTGAALSQDLWLVRRVHWVTRRQTRINTHPFPRLREHSVGIWTGEIGYFSIFDFSCRSSRHFDLSVSSWRSKREL